MYTHESKCKNDKINKNTVRVPDFMGHHSCPFLATVNSKYSHVKYEPRDNVFGVLKFCEPSQTT
jgi:hypothetical protein